MRDRFRPGRTVRGMVELFPDPQLAAILAAVGAIVSLFLVPYAAKRAVAQPLEIAVEDEVRLLLGVLSDLRRLPYLTTLTPEDFAAGANGRIWATLLKVAAPELSHLSANPTDEECAQLGAELVERADQVHAELHRLLGLSPNAAADLARLAYLSNLSTTTDLSDDDVVDAGQAVLLTGTGRNKLSGSGLVVASTTPDSVDPAQPPIRRVLAVPSRLRRFLTAVVTAASAALLPGFVAAADLTGAAGWVALGALAVLLAGSVVIALVDLDTMYVDLRTFLVTAGGAWALAGAAVALAGEWTRAIAGVVVVVAVAVVFELANRIYRLLRGVDGQGFGDTLIVIATVGVPPALTGDWTLGYYSGMAAMAVAVLGWGIGFARGKFTRSTPMAFGPYLAGGWILGWAVWALIGA